MAVNKEFRCAVHGPFESSDEAPLCPAGCDCVTREFRTPVGFRSARTANIDSTIASLAKSHNLTDISNRGGRAAIRENPQARRQQEEFNAMIRERYGDGWGALPKGGDLNVQTGQIEGSGPGVRGALGQYHAAPDNVLAEVAPALVPKPVIYKKDHENLQVDVSKAPA